MWKSRASYDICFSYRMLVYVEVVVGSGWYWGAETYLGKSVHSTWVLVVKLLEGSLKALNL